MLSESRIIRFSPRRTGKIKKYGAQRGPYPSLNRRNLPEKGGYQISSFQFYPCFGP